MMPFKKNQPLPAWGTTTKDLDLFLKLSPLTTRLQLYGPRRCYVNGVPRVPSKDAMRKSVYMSEWVTTVGLHISNSSSRFKYSIVRTDS